jgi:cell shape-determining protein MreC
LEISKIDKEDYGITQTIEITPSVDFHKLEEVVVLIEREGLGALDQESVDIMSKQIKKENK